MQNYNLSIEMFRKQDSVSQKNNLSPHLPTYTRVMPSNQGRLLSYDQQLNKPMFSSIKEDLSHVLKSIENKKILKGHYRNSSDIIHPTEQKLMSLSYGHPPNYNPNININPNLSHSQHNHSHSQDPISNGNRIMWAIEQRDDGFKIMDSRLYKIEERMASIQDRLRKSETGKCFEDALAASPKQYESRLQEISMQVLEVRQKIQKFDSKLAKIKFPTQESKLSKMAPQLSPQQAPSQQRMVHLEQCIQQLKKQLSTKIQQLSQKQKSPAHKQYQQAINPETQFFRTNRKYSGNHISLAYEQYIRKNQKDSEKVCINQITYYLDEDGFLLDENQHYLVNSRMQQVRLSEKELKMLRKYRILPTPHS